MNATRPSRLRRSDRGFTLIELLVVIAIIGILLGILLPALKRSRDAAKLTKCLSQMKTLGQATIAYEMDMKKYPNSSGMFDGSGQNRDYSLYEALKDYADLSKPQGGVRTTWVCPMDTGQWYQFLGVNYIYYPWAVKQTSEVYGIPLPNGKKLFFPVMSIYRINTHLPLFTEGQNPSFHDRYIWSMPHVRADGSARFSIPDYRIWYPE